jgi:leader peptidase (prepilin peptidase)/N-methyltransferase
LVLAVLGAGVGFGVFFALYWLGRRLFGPGALGFGDVMLSAMMGAMLGFPYIVFALVIGILLGGAISLLLILVRRLSMQSYVAYGPFLAMAGIITVVWGEQILAWYVG